MTRIPLKGGAEYDALTKENRFHNFRRGERKAIKRQYNKRFRKVSRCCLD